MVMMQKGVLFLATALAHTGVEGRQGLRRQTKEEDSYVYTVSDALCTSFTNAEHNCSAFDLQSICSIEDDNGTIGCIENDSGIDMRCGAIVYGIYGLNANDTATCKDKCKGFLQSCCVDFDDSLDCSDAEFVEWDSKHKSKKSEKETSKTEKEDEKNEDEEDDEESVVYTNSDATCQSFAKDGANCSAYALESICRKGHENGTVVCVASEEDVAAQCQTIARGIYGLDFNDTAMCSSQCNDVLQSCCVQTDDNIDCSSAEIVVWDDWYEGEEDKRKKQKEEWEEHIQEDEEEEEVKEKGKGQDKFFYKDHESYIYTKADSMCSSFSTLQANCSAAVDLESICSIETANGTAECIEAEEDIATRCDTIVEGIYGLNFNDTSKCADECKGFMQSCCIDHNEDLDCSHAEYVEWDDKHDSKKSEKKEQQHVWESYMQTKSDAMCTKFANEGTNCSAYEWEAICSIETGDGMFTCARTEEDVNSRCNMILGGIEGLNSPDTETCTSQCSDILMSCCVAYDAGLDCSNAEYIEWESKHSEKSKKTEKPKKEKEDEENEGMENIVEEDGEASDSEEGEKAPVKDALEGEVQNGTLTELDFNTTEADEAEDGSEQEHNATLTELDFNTTETDESEDGSELEHNATQVTDVPDVDNQSNSTQDLNGTQVDQEHSHVDMEPSNVTNVTETDTEEADSEEGEKAPVKDALEGEMQNGTLTEIDFNTTESDETGDVTNANETDTATSEEKVDAEEASTTSAPATTSDPFTASAPTVAEQWPDEDEDDEDEDEEYEDWHHDYDSYVYSKSDAICTRFVDAKKECSSYDLESICSVYDDEDGTMGCVENEGDTLALCETIVSGIYGLNSSDTATCETQCKDFMQSCCIDHDESLDCSEAEYVKWHKKYKHEWEEDATEEEYESHIYTVSDATCQSFTSGETADCSAHHLPSLCGCYDDATHTMKCITESEDVSYRCEEIVHGIYGLNSLDTARCTEQCDDYVQKCCVENADLDCSSGKYIEWEDEHVDPATLEQMKKEKYNDADLMCDDITTKGSDCSAYPLDELCATYDHSDNFACVEGYESAVQKCEWISHEVHKFEDWEACQLQCETVLQKCCSANVADCASVATKSSPQFFPFY